MPQQEKTFSLYCNCGHDKLIMHSEIVNPNLN